MLTNLISMKTNISKSKNITDILGIIWCKHTKEITRNNIPTLKIIKLILKANKNYQENRG